MGNFYLLLAETYQKLKRYEEGIVAIDKALEYETQVYYYYFKGVLLFDQGKYKESIESYSNAIDLNPRASVYYANRGKAYRFIDKEKAILDFDKSLSIECNSKAYMQKGYTLYDLKRYEEALEALQKGILLCPDVADAHCCLGDTLDHMGRHEEAIPAYDDALRLCEDDSITWNNKGVALNNLKRYEEAITALDRSIELDPEDATAYCQKGYSYFHLGELDLAMQLYDKAIQLYPEYEKAIARRSELQKLLANKQ
jgi:tetratricopeptide (TPR) repeat protein